MKSLTKEKWHDLIDAFNSKECAPKDYISLQKKVVGETNILQQIL